jgi:Flp pilus assembly protein TadD/mono/diheme cytochrome c family protein
MAAWIPRGMVLSAAALAGCSSGAPAASRPQPRTVITFNEDIAPVFYQNCVSCHRPGQLAPFGLLTYADARQHAGQIAVMTKAHTMPPWPPEAGYGEFSHERRLSVEQIDLIQRWVSNGAIEGDPGTRPATPNWLDDEWQLGRPDMVLETPPYTLQADGTDVFRSFVLPPSITSTRYVRGVEFRPGNRRLVHHAVIRIDRTRVSRRLDEKDPAPGYDGMLVDNANAPDGHFLGWTPGKAPSMEPAGMAWRLDPGNDLVVQLHLLPTGKPELVKAQIGLFFTDTPPSRVPFMIRLGSVQIDIPAGKSDYTISDTYVLPVGVEALSVYPHAHYIAKDIKGFATLPGGTVKWLIWIKDWDFHWQDVYQYATPISLPRGTTLTMQYTYDNSDENRHNPHHPARRVVFGPASSDEMGDLWLQVLPRNADDLAVLGRDFQQREVTFAITNSERLVKAAPNDAEGHNFLAARYLDAGKIPEALAELTEALRLSPNQPEAHNNLGIALQRQGRLTEAIQQFRQAVSGDPRSAEAHNNLGVALYSQGKLDEAAEHFRQALTLQPDYGDAHTSLGFVLGAQGKSEEARGHFRRALEINPDDIDARKGLQALSK